MRARHACNAASGALLGHSRPAAVASLLRRKHPCEARRLSPRGTPAHPRAVCDAATRCANASVAAGTRSPPLG